MGPNDFIYQSIYKGCLSQKVNEGVARDAAVMGLDAYKKGKFKSAKLLINDAIVAAKKRSKGVK